MDQGWIKDGSRMDQDKNAPAGVRPTIGAMNSSESAASFAL
jgi:hypothetical protein